MSVTTRTNRATNPSVASASTNWASVAGTGGTATGTRNAGAGFDGMLGFFRVAWTVATTAASGGFTYTGTGLSISTQYTHSVWVKASKAITVRLTAQYQTSGAVNTGTAVNGTAVALTANTWTRITVTSTSTSTTDRVVLTAAASSGLWANGDTFDGDCLMIEAAATAGEYFDGSYTDGNGIDYGWVSTANASNSTAITYNPVLTLLHKTDAPGDRVEITITDLHSSTHSVTLWRTADGERLPVRGYRRVDVVGSDFTTDYEVPLKRLVTYELEVLTGLGLNGPSAEATITVTTTKGYIQDPLAPASMISLLANENVGEPTLMDTAIRQLEYAADMSMVKILGSNKPVALLGERMVANNVPFNMTTNAAQYATDLRELMQQTPLLLIRTLPEWGAGLPGLCYVAAPSVKELPTTAWGGTLTEWEFSTGLVQAPNMRIIVPTWTYQDWQDLWTTYQQAQTTLAGDSYLQVKKSPTGA